MSRRGAVLLQAVIMSMLACFIASRLLLMNLQGSLDAALTASSIDKTKRAEAALNRVELAWARGGTCASGAGVDCRGSGCSCRCTLPGLPVVSSSGRPQGPCRLLVAVDN